MAIARSTGALFGTDEATLTSVANNATGNGSEVDVLADNASTGTVHLYAVITSTVAVGTIDIKVNPRRLTTQVYAARSAQFTVAPTNGTQKLYLGAMSATRYMQADVLNNATGASATVSVLYELHKVS